MADGIELSFDGAENSMKVPPPNDINPYDNDVKDKDAEEAPAEKPEEPEPEETSTPIEG